MNNTLKDFNIKAKKSFWQNFLQNTQVLEKISREFDIKWKNILEIWPWYWALTTYLLHEKPSALTLVELDLDMIEVLNQRIEKKELVLGNTDFQIINIDILKYEPNFSDYFVIANIPYYITSPILRKFLYDVTNKPKAMLILMQKEVWEKIIHPKNKSSVLSLYIQKKRNSSKIIDVKNTDFHPAPKVDSVVIKFELHDKYKENDDDEFLEFIKLAFKEPRKMLIKNLSSKYEISNLETIFDDLKIDKKARAEDLDLEKYLEMIEKIKS